MFDFDDAERPTPEVTSPARLRDGLAMAIAALFVYLLLAQGSFYKVDGQALLYLSHLGATQHGYHTFYLPLLSLVKALAMPLGMSLFESATLLSAIGTSIGVLLVHFASRRLGLDRITTNIATALFALCPGIVFFATVVEVHGAFLPFAGLAMLASAHAARSPSVVNAVLLGLALGTAYLAHPTGALIICLVPAVQAASMETTGSGVSRGRRAAIILIAGAVLAVVLALVPRLLRSGGAAVDVGTAASIVQTFSAHGFSILRLPEVVLDEWLVPFLMASVVALLAARNREGRVLLGFLLLGLTPYVVGTQLMLRDFSERGAYLLPTAWPTAVLAAIVLRAWPLPSLIAIALSIVTAIVQIDFHDEPERPRSFAEGLRELTGAHGFQLLAGHELDMEAYFIAFDDQPVLYLGQFMDFEPAAAKVTLQNLDAWIARQRSTGRATFMSDLAVQSLREAAERGEWPLSHDPELWVGGRAATTILAHLESNYEFDPAQAKGFSGVRLVPRR